MSGLIPGGPESLTLTGSMTWSDQNCPTKCAYFAMFLADLGKARGCSTKTLVIGDGAFSHKIDYIRKKNKFIPNLKGHKNCIIGS